jgi:hypothetical protein
LAVVIGVDLVEVGLHPFRGFFFAQLAVVVLVHHLEMLLHHFGIRTMAVHGRSTGTAGSGGTAGATGGRATGPAVHGGSAGAAVHGRTAGTTHGGPARAAVHRGTTGATRRRTTAMFRHCRVDATRPFHELLFAQLAVFVLIEGVEHSAGIRHSRRAARARGRGAPALRLGSVTVMTVMSPGLRSPLVVASMMIRPLSLLLIASTAFPFFRAVGQHDLRQCDDRQSRQ